MTMFLYFYSFLILLAQFGAETEKKANDWSLIMQMLGQFFFLIVVFAFIIYVAYVATKYIGVAKFAKGKNLNVKIIESVSVGGQNMLQVIKAGDKYILIGVSKDKVSFISELNAASIVMNESNVIDFKSTFDKYLKKGNTFGKGDVDDGKRS